MTRQPWTRRSILKGISLLGASMVGGALARPRIRAHAATASAAGEPRFLIVLGATGGASIIDSVMAIRESESANASTLDCFPDALVQNIDNSPFRAVDLSGESTNLLNTPFTTNQAAFVRKHHADMMVATWTRTSVVHSVGQRRAVTGNEAWRGRTIQEVAAMTHGANAALPNVHLAMDTNYTERGGDNTLPSYSYGEPVPNPVLWPLALDGMRGTAHPVDRDLLARARALRDTTLDPLSRFNRAFGNSPHIRHWEALRGDRQAALEAADLITKLMLVPDSAETPLAAHGLETSPTGQLVRERLPNYATDPLEAQAALAFLMFKYRVSVSVTLGPNFDLVIADGEGDGSLPAGSLTNPPIGFDLSHFEHRTTQAFMWERIMRVADSLIELLKSEELSDGVSMWDRTLLYVASDFGRVKTRPANAEQFGTPHHVNNGVILLSPLVKGNTLLGGVDADTGLTYGFDPVTGAPDPGRNMTEAEIYAGIVQALGVDTSGSGLPDMPAMRRG